MIASLVDDTVPKFRQCANVSVDTATKWLAAHQGDVEATLNAFYESGGQLTTPHRTGEDSVSREADASEVMQSGQPPLPVRSRPAAGGPSPKGSPNKRPSKLPRPSTPDGRRVAAEMGGVSGMEGVSGGAVAEPQLPPPQLPTSVSVLGLRNGPED